MTRDGSHHMNKKQVFITLFSFLELITLNCWCFIIILGEIFVVVFCKMVSAYECKLYFFKQVFFFEDWRWLILPRILKYKVIFIFNNLKVITYWDDLKPIAQYSDTLLKGLHQKEEEVRWHFAGMTLSFKAHPSTYFFSAKEFPLIFFLL